MTIFPLPLLFLLPNQLLEPVNIPLKGCNLSIKLCLATMGPAWNIHHILDVMEMRALSHWVFAVMWASAAVVVVYLIKVTII